MRYALSLPAFPALAAALLFLALAGVTSRAALAAAAGDIPTASVDLSDPIAVLQARLDKGQDRLAYEPGPFGYLRDLLAHLRVDPDSQMLVFSKTSFQSDLIGPDRPRAIYFNDQVAVGYVQNSPALELMTATAAGGYAFYTLDNTRPGAPHVTPHRDSTCSRCHGADFFSPGMIVASTPVERDGMPVFIPSDGPARLFNFTDQTSPFATRWGGWYITGTHGGEKHQGNGARFYGGDGSVLPGAPQSQNLTTLDAFFDTGKYLAPSGDIVAIMTFEHQARMTNMLLAAGTAARRGALADGGLDELLAYMLYVDEAPLRAPVRGTSAFAAHFSQRGPRDALGRSLRDFELSARLFKYPLSYMVYSPSFEALPAEAKARVYTRLHDILNGAAGPRFARLTPEDRSAVLEILVATKKDLPASWRAVKRLSSLGSP